MKRKHSKEEASLVIRNAGTMSKRYRRNLAGWLHYQAELLIKEGDQFAPHFKSTRTK